eukprot:1158308-Pelagomonas_calceolata.AAC.13
MQGKISKPDEAAGFLILIRKGLVQPFLLPSIQHQQASQVEADRDPVFPDLGPSGATHGWESPYKQERKTQCQQILNDRPQLVDRW